MAIREHHASKHFFHALFQSIWLKFSRQKALSKKHCLNADFAHHFLENCNMRSGEGRILRRGRNPMSLFEQFRPISHGLWPAAPPLTAWLNRPSKNLPCHQLAFWKDSSFCLIIEKTHLFAFPLLRHWREGELHDPNCFKAKCVKSNTPYAKFWGGRIVLGLNIIIRIYCAVHGCATQCKLN